MGVILSEGVELLNEITYDLLISDIWCNGA